ncbi:MAG: TldD/PmbA family protein [Myxococcales bacterium]|nr:TldD/PmbA family protein [Myxococcales bacterium]MCB9648138.1 TldD/PmbA family protein [Deltaproteobacteria bacterium]
MDLGARVVEAARKAGADVAEVLAVDSADLSAKVRMGEPELIEEAGSHGLGLRVIKEGRSAITYTSDPTEDGLAALVADALELAALSEPDELALPPDPSELATAFPELDLYDPAGGGVDAAQATEWALAAEQAARDVDPRITNSEGATYGRTRSAVALVTSGGFSAGYRGSYQSLHVAPIADDADGKKRNGFYWDARRHLAAMATPESVGQEAARRTLAKLGAKKVPTAEVPVVFDPDAGRALLSLFFSCVSGGAIYKRASYLIGKEGERVASDLVTFVDDPLLARAPGSRPFDGEGLASRRNVVVEQGILRTWLMDTYSARKLDKQSTASAARGVGGRPSVAPTNFHLLAGSASAEEVVAGVKSGLYVTSMMGFGFNAVTGDFSRGAEGFWIEDGKLTFPVSEVTISLNFNELWASVDAVASDLDPKTRYACPTFRVSKMTLAGTSA